MRSVRTPHRARAWIGSTPFWSWIVISVVATAVQLGLPWIGYDPQQLQRQLANELVTAAVIELV
jgi:cytochrome c oxidase assembly factor CtaG